MADINEIPTDQLSPIPTNEVGKKMAAKKGETVGATASEDESIQDACRDMFKKVSEYLKSELSASQEDYELLEKLNELTKLNYNQMDNVTIALIGQMKAINEKYENLKPFLAMVDKVDTSVSNLEQAAYKLDAYSKELEARFKKLEKTASI